VEAAKPNCALIGLGGFGRQHFRALRSLEKAGRIRLSAICDPDAYGVPDVQDELRSLSVRIYDDWEQMLSREPDLTAVTIAAPIPLHYRMAKACLDNNLFVYLEKPPVPLLDQLDELIAADARERVSVGFQMIQSPWSRQIKNWIIDGALGDLTEIRAGACWPRSDGYYKRANWAGRMAVDGEAVFDGPATNGLAHLIHNIMFFAGGTFETFATPLEVQGELYRARPIESYDTAFLRGGFESGVRFSAAMTHASGKLFDFEIHVIGSKGWARVSQGGKMLESHLGPTPCTADAGIEVEDAYCDFFDYISGKKRRPATLLRDTRGYLLATNAALLSSGGIHTIPPSHFRQIEDGGAYSIHGIHKLITDSLRNPETFSETEVPWIVQSHVVHTDCLAPSESLDEFFDSNHFFNSTPQVLASTP